jgi:GAF domain-containing protein
MGLWYTLHQELGLHPSLRDTLTRVLHLSIESVGAESGSIMLIDECGQIGHAALVYAGKTEAFPTASMHAVVREGLARWVIEHRRAALVSSTREDPRWLRQAWDEQHRVARSAICVPLMCGHSILGVLTLVQRHPSGYSASDLALLSALAFCASSTSLRAAMLPVNAAWQ